METIKLDDVANELGMTGNNLFQKVKELYSEVKSSKSKISIETAEEIFNLMLSNSAAVEKNTISEQLDVENIHISITSENIDIDFIERIASLYKKCPTQEFLIGSFNFSNESIVKILTAGMISLDIKQYVNQKCSGVELQKLILSMKKVLNDVDYEDYENSKNPLKELINEIENYQPEIVYIEGLKEDIDNNIELFEAIKLYAQQGIKFEISIVQSKTKKNIKKIIEYFNVSTLVK